MAEQLTARAYDPDFSHTMLILVLMKQGGSIVLNRADFTPDALRTDEDVLYRIALDPLPDNKYRLAVAPVAADRAAG